MKRVIFALLFIVFHVAAFSIDFEDALTFAYSNNSDLKNISNQIEIAGQILHYKKLSQLPKLNFSYSYKGNVINSNNYLYLNSAFNYPVYDGGFRSYEVAYVHTYLQILRLNFEQKKKEIEYNTRILYYSAVFSQKVMEMREKYLQQAKMEKQANEARYREGILDKLACLASEHFVISSEYQLYVAKNEWKRKIRDLGDFIISSTVYSVEGEFTKTEEKLKLTGDLRISNLKLQKELVLINYKKEFASVDWNVNLYSYSYYSQMLNNNIVKYGFSTGVQIYFPLFDWLSMDANTAYDGTNILIGGNINLLNQDQNSFRLYQRSANITNEIFQTDIDLQIKKIETENDMISEKIVEFEMGIIMASNAIILNKYNYEKIWIQVETGSKTAKDLFDARLAIIDSEILYLRALFKYNQCIWEIQKFLI